MSNYEESVLRTYETSSGSGAVLSSAGSGGGATLSHTESSLYGAADRAVQQVLSGGITTSGSSAYFGATGAGLGSGGLYGSSVAYSSGGGGGGGGALGGGSSVGLITSSGGNNQYTLSSGGGNNNFGAASLSLGAGQSFSAGGAQGGSFTAISSSSSSGGAAQFLSEIEASILRSTVPITVNETEEITVAGQRGIWANRQEVANWRGIIPITQYIINEDNNPEIITKRTQEQLTYIQELAIRYLRPPTPPAPGEIVITQEANTATPPAPPVVIRQAPPRPPTPEPLVLREAPPQPPGQCGRKMITISGKRLPPPPRKVVIERLAPLPSKPQSVIIERWLPYSQVKRRVIFQKSAGADPVVVKPRNVIVQWEAPSVVVKKEIKYLGVIRANPAEYVQRYGATLKTARELPDFVHEIKTPDGLVLAADYRYNRIHELEGELEAFRLVDLEREGLSEYREQLERLSIRYSAAAVSASFSSSQLVGGGGSFVGGGGSFSGGGASSFSSGGGAGTFGGGAGTFGGGAGTFGGASSFSSSSSTGGGGSQSALLIQEVFSSVDRDSNGFISLSEAESLLQRLNVRLGRNYGESEAREFIHRLDKNGDGQISLAEFRAAFERGF